MEELDDLLYDDVEAKFLALENKKKKRKKRRRKFKLMLLAIVIIAGTLYFCSSASKVKSLEVRGNVFYTRDMVLKKAGLSYESRYLVYPKFYLEWQLEKDDLIEDAIVSKSLDGTISIEVKEKTIVGYYYDSGKTYVLANDGTSQEITSENLDTIVNFPFIDGFDKTQRKNLAKAFKGSTTSVDRDIIAMISEMQPHKESYDAHMVEVIMQDGNRLYVSYGSIPMLNSYKSVLKDLRKTHVCFVIMDKTDAYSTEDCKSFQ